MVHQRQRLPLGLEPGDDLLGVHAQLDDLERDAAADRLLLLGHINHAAAAFADLLEQFVAADPVAGLFARRQAADDGRLRWGSDGGCFEWAVTLFVEANQVANPLDQLDVTATRGHQIRLTLHPAAVVTRPRRWPLRVDAFHA